MEHSDATTQTEPGRCEPEGHRRLAQHVVPVIVLCALTGTLTFVLSARWFDAVRAPADPAASAAVADADSMSDSAIPSRRSQPLFGPLQPVRLIHHRHHLPNVQAQESHPVPPGHLDRG